jgi:serine/threonine-protein kinase
LDNGRQYVVVEWIDGQTLLRHMGDHERGTWRYFRIDEILDLGCALAKALGAAHAIGVLHRDVKPANVIVPSVNGTLSLADVKLIDFGIASPLDQMIPTGELRTQTRTRAGTSLYSAPEQMSGRRQSPATDVFVLGAMLFELVYGYAPMCRNDDDVVRYEIQYYPDVPPVCVVVVPNRMSQELVMPSEPFIQEQLRDLLARMLRWDPAARPQTMDEVLACLRMVRADVRETIPAA